MNKGKSIIGFILCIVGFIGCLKCVSDRDTDEEAKQVSSAKAENTTPAQKLATLDAGTTYTIGAYDDRTLEIQKHLTSLSALYKEPEEQIANSIYIASKQLADKGLNYSSITLLRVQDNGDHTFADANIKFAEVLSTMVSITTK